MDAPQAIAQTRERTEETPQVIALRDGDALPDGYTFVVKTTSTNIGPTTERTRSRLETVELSTPPRGATNIVFEKTQTLKGGDKERRNATRNTNRQATAAFARELKDSCTGGRPPKINGGEDETHLKARWHAAAKEIAYKMLDLREDGWKRYSIFDKGRVHKQLNATYKFDPPLEPRRVDKYLSGHLRSSRAVWKAHWQRYGDFERHHNCPEEAWDRLIQWWPTEACKEESADMASRRSLVQTHSSAGRKSMVDRMQEEVSSQF